MTLSPEDADLLFGTARTHSYWLDRDVRESLLEEAWNQARMAPTAANCQPLRLVFVKSKDAKERLKPCLAPGNVDKTMKAPVTAICAYDLDFPETLPRLFPQTDAKSWFAGKPDFTENTARLSAALQAAYFLLACRGLGLDLGPMGGFDPAKVNEAFFPSGSVKAFLLMNIGYGDAAKLHPRNPRPDFKDVCAVA
jgi:3-hydroxypropanoate dehydrogenase